MDQYIQSSILTAGPEKLIQMIYEKAVEILKSAISNFENRDLRTQKLLKAQEIILYLNATLDMEKGGMISRNFRELYDFIYRQLVEANMNDDSEKVKVSLELVQDMLSTWKEALKKAGLTSASNQQRGFSVSV